MAVGYAAAFEQGPLHGVVVCALQIEVKELAINLNKVRCTAWSCARAKSGERCLGITQAPQVFDFGQPAVEARALLANFL